MDCPRVLSAVEWGPAKKAMSQATRLVLPTDQVSLARGLVVFRNNSNSEVVLEERNCYCCLSCNALSLLVGGGREGRGSVRNGHVV